MAESKLFQGRNHLTMRCGIRVRQSAIKVKLYGTLGCLSSPTSVLSMYVYGREVRLWAEIGPRCSVHLKELLTLYNLLRCSSNRQYGMVRFADIESPAALWCSLDVALVQLVVHSKDRLFKLTDKSLLVDMCRYNISVKSWSIYWLEQPISWMFYQIYWSVCNQYNGWTTYF